MFGNRTKSSHIDIFEFDYQKIKTALTKSDKVKHNQTLSHSILFGNQTFNCQWVWLVECSIVFDWQNFICELDYVWLLNPINWLVFQVGSTEEM